MNSVQDVASHLGLSDVRVRQLIHSGALDAERVGSRWVVSDDALHAYRVVPAHRPWEAASAWGFLWLLAGRPAPWLTDKQRERVRRRMADGLSFHTAALRSRAELITLAAHPSALARLHSEPGVVRSGLSAAADYAADLVGSGDVFEGYVRAEDMAKLKKRYVLTESARRPNVRLHANDKIWPFDPNEGLAPAIVVALDLLESTDQRTSRAGNDLMQAYEPRSVS